LPGPILEILTKPKLSKKIKSILSSGITTFVSLQTPEEIHRFVPYKNVIDECLKSNPQFKQPKFVEFPIPDQFVAPTDKVFDFIEQLCVLLNAGENLYIHCWGGHGRTGTIIGCLIGRLYPISAQLALDLTSTYHHKRKPPKSRSPQGQRQCEQVKEVVDKYRSNSS